MRLCWAVRGSLKWKSITVLEQGLYVSLLRVRRVLGCASSAFCSLLWLPLSEGGGGVAV